LFTHNICIHERSASEGEDDPAAPQTTTTKPVPANSKSSKTTKIDKAKLLRLLNDDDDDVSDLSSDSEEAGDINAASSDDEGKDIHVKNFFHYVLL
jgi:hypothetical protein